MASAALSDAKRRLLERCRQGALPSSARPRPAIGRRPPGLPVPLSYGQQLLWLHAQLAPELPVYNEPITVHRRGPLDVAALERALHEILRRHEAWRTTFPAEGGEPVQAVQTAPAVALPVVDLRGLPAERIEPEALRLATEDARRPFDLAQGPLLRALLVRLADDEHRLFLTLHHIIFDGVSTYRVFLPELTALYEAFAAGRAAALPEPALQFGDYATWQRQQPAAAASGQLAYWRERLRDLPDLELPTDRMRPPVQAFRGAMQPLALPMDLSAALRALSRREGVTLFVTLLATFETLLHRYSGQEDIVVGTVTAGRSRPETQDLLGFFLNPLLLRTDLSGAPTFRELLQRVRMVAIEALANEDVPFETLVKELRPRRDPSRNPLYQALFSLEPPLPALPPGWDLTQSDIETGAAKLDLYLELDDRPAGIVGRFMYNTDLFDRATIARMLGHWQTLLAAVVHDPDRRLSQLPLLTDAERRPRRGPAPVTISPEETVSGRFEAMAAAHPYRVAVREPGGEWTYDALNRRANRMGHTLRRAVGGGEHRVALLLGHGATMVAAMLAALKAGLAYVPLDPRYPRQRLEYILRDAQASVLLTEGAQRGLAHDLAAGAVPVIEVEAPAGTTASSDNLGLTVSADALAYLLYTSGSTGRPKGVMQTQRNVLHFIRAYAGALDIGPADRLTLISSCSFDASVMDVFGALLNGATLCPIDAGAGGLSTLPDALARTGATIYHSTPSVFRSWIGAGRGPGRMAAVRAVVLGGEEVLETDVLLCRRHFGPDTVLVNLAGQTESSLTLLNVLDRHAVLGRTSVPLGHPVAGTDVVLLAEDGTPTELSGEIGIRSAHVAPGYWRQPDLTRERFLPDPRDAERRLFRTGDRGRLLADGSFAFQGRRDLQVKVRGVRIELGEIESVLCEHPGVRAAAAMVWEPVPGDRRLAAYWVAAPGPGVTAGALRDFLRTRLPEPMVPSVFLPLDALPRTPSGKLDRRALRPPALPFPDGERTFVAPRNPLEERLAALWEALLGVGRVGVTDDFFDLGGHSLLAVRLFAEIERELGLRAPLGTLLEAPTVERLARVLAAQRPVPRASLVPLQPRGAHPPFFAVHGHSGEVLFYRDLARRLGPEQPFFALQALGLTGAPAQRSIEAMAARYIEELRAVQPVGPYRVGGYCLGALVAFEIACQLVDQGHAVALLALFVGRGLASGRRSLAERARHVARRARADGARGALRSLLGAVALRLPSWLARNVAQTNLQAARKYVPRRYPGRMTVFLSGCGGNGASLDPRRDLDGLTAGEVDVVPVPGTTDTMMAEPHVGALSEGLQDRLAAAGGSARGDGGMRRDPGLHLAHRLHPVEG